MDDNKALNKSSDETQNYTTDNDDSQDQTEESDRNPTTLENPVTPSVRQDTSDTNIEMGDFPKDDDEYEDASEEESGGNPTTPESQVMPSVGQDAFENVVEMEDESGGNPITPESQVMPSVGQDAFENVVDMEDSPKDNVKYEVASEEGYGRIPTTLENQDISSVVQNASENQQQSSGPSVSTSESTSQALNTDQASSMFDEDVFYSSLFLQTRRGCSPFADALLSPRRCPSRLTAQILKQSDIDCAKIYVRDLQTGHASSLRPYSGFVTRNLSLIRNFTVNPTPRRGRERVRTGVETASGSISRSERLGRRSRDSNAFESSIPIPATDINPESDSSSLTSKPHAKSRSKSAKSLPIIDLETFRTAVDNVVLSLGIQDSGEQQMEVDRIDLPLLHEHLDSISSDRVPSKAPRELSGGNSPPPNLDVHEGQPSTLGHQPQINDGSYAGNRVHTSLCLTPLGDTSNRVAKSNTSDEKTSKCASRAQNLLLDVLKEMMELDGEGDLFKEFQELFCSVSKSPCFNTEFALHRNLLFYLLEKQIARRSNKDSPTPREMIFENKMQDADGVLTRTVVATLILTATVEFSLNSELIMIHYRSLRNVFDKYREFWGNHYLEDIKDEASRNRVAGLREKLEKFMLQTRPAFQYLLMHIGEHAEQDDIDRYEKVLFEEDKMYLRRRIL